jgi:tRNA threonylcarbamoyladenosine biosynthesis protein TsaB
MTILAIDTSTQWCSVAIFFSVDRFVLRHEKVGPSASQVLLPWIANMMQESQLVWQDISSLAVSQGPGAFTGIRLGIGVAQGLAYSQNKPLIPIPSIDGMIAQQFLNHPELFKNHTELYGVLDARMDELYVGKYTHSEDGRLHRLGEIQLTPLNTFYLKAAAGYFIHESPTLLSQESIEKPMFLKEASPHALGIAYMASQIEYTQNFLPKECQPLYVRDQVALTIEQRAAKL